MLNGAFALLGRSLRIDARSWPTHVTRLGLVVAIYFALCITLATEDQFGAPGLRFFEGIAYLDLVFMTLLGLGFFSTPITEEKEEDTLGLMLMAGISPLGILAGKSGGRVGQALLLVAVQYPLMMLAVTMGGITPVQIIAVTMALLAYMLLLAGFGLLCSTLASSSRKASGWVIVGLVLYFFVSGSSHSLDRSRWRGAFVTKRGLGVPGSGEQCQCFPEIDGDPVNGFQRVCLELSGHQQRGDGTGLRPVILAIVRRGDAPPRDGSDFPRTCCSAARLLPLSGRSSSNQPFRLEGFSFRFRRRGDDLRPHYLLWQHGTGRLGLRFHSWVAGRKRIRHRLPVMDVFFYRRGRRDDAVSFDAR